MQLTSNMQIMSKAHTCIFFIEDTKCVCTNTPLYINALADAFIPCNLDWLQVIHFISSCISWKSNP